MTGGREAPPALCTAPAEGDREMFMTRPVRKLNAAAMAGPGLLAAALLVGAPARAHISLEQGGTHLSRDGDGSLKDAPCGLAGSTRGTNAYTYEAGETITVTLKETIPHPSYFRIAFDDDGDDGFAEPASIKPIDPARKCPFNAADKCGEDDFYNNDTVLMDDLDPHLPNGQKTYTWEVTLPDVACDNCTLQVMQVMQDTIHGAYNPVPGDPADIPYIADNYHQCIDLVLTRPAGSGTGADAGDGSGGGAKSSGDDGGCSVAGVGRGAGSGALWVLAALGLAARLGRGRRR